MSISLEYDMCFLTRWTLITITFSIVVGRFVCLTLTELEDGYWPLPFLIARQRIFFTFFHISRKLKKSLFGSFQIGLNMPTTPARGNRHIFDYLDGPVRGRLGWEGWVGKAVWG